MPNLLSHHQTIAQLETTLGIETLQETHAKEVEEGNGQWWVMLNDSCASKAWTWVWFSSWSCKHINGNLIGQWKRQQHNHRHNGTRLGSADHHCQWTTNWTTRLDYKLWRIALNLRLAWTHHRKLGQREQQFVIIGTTSFNKRTLILGHNHPNRRWPADRVRTIDNDARALTENIDRWSLSRRHDRIPYRRASQRSDEIELSRSVWRSKWTKNESSEFDFVKKL